MKTKTYTFRLYQVTNGLNETYFRAKEKWFLWFWKWVKLVHWRMDFNWTEIGQWENRQDAIEALTKRAQDSRDSENGKLRDKLKIVFIEEVKL